MPVGHWLQCPLGPSPLGANMVTKNGPTPNALRAEWDPLGPGDRFLCNHISPLGLGLTLNPKGVRAMPYGHWP
jgi:hypothetical protein